MGLNFQRATFFPELPTDLVIYMGLSFPGANLGQARPWGLSLISCQPANLAKIDGAKLPTSYILPGTAHGSGNIYGAKLFGRKFWPDWALGPLADLLPPR